MDDKIQLIQQKVTDLLSQDQSGHGMEHINHVLELSCKFAKQEQADIALTSIIALLHDADDYKLFGSKTAADLPNAKRIMAEANIDQKIQQRVCEEIRHLGYAKRLQGIYPQTLEGQIVSDADMCEGLGTAGILRAYQYGLAHHRPFFQKNIHPNTHYSPKSYVLSNTSETTTDHFFEKLLRLKNLMLTQSGKHEAQAHAYPVR